MNCNLILESLVVKIKCGLCHFFFFDMSEDSTLCTWQFYILATDSSRPCMAQKCMLSWNMCFRLLAYLFQFSSMKELYLYWIITCKKQFFFLLRTILSHHYKNISYFLFVFSLGGSFITTTTINFTLYILYSHLWLNICLMNLEILRSVVIFVL